jgi:3-hydroxypropanoate dehydrogenase
LPKKETFIMTESLIDPTAMDLLFRDARSQNKWLDRAIPDGTLEAIYDLMKWGPTSANGFPIRIVFVTSDEAKEKLAGVAMSGNQEKIRTAPATAILGNDAEFFERMDRLFPHNPKMADMFRGNSELAQITAMRNGTLQGAYFMIAARALGLDCGPMSGFDNAACDELFFAGTKVKSNFICSIGYGDPDGLFDRLPRPDFDEVCSVV